MLMKKHRGEGPLMQKKLETSSRRSGGELLTPKNANYVKSKNRF
jgi:hypothetical protein